MVDAETRSHLLALQREIAELRGEINEYRIALGASDRPGAVAGLRRIVRYMESLSTWAKTMTPPFNPPQ